MGLCLVFVGLVCCEDHFVGGFGLFFRSLVWLIGGGGFCGCGFCGLGVNVIYRGLVVLFFVVFLFWLVFACVLWGHLLC